MRGAGKREFLFGRVEQRGAVRVCGLSADQDSLAASIAYNLRTYEGPQLVRVIFSTETFVAAGLRRWPVTVGRWLRRCNAL